MIPDAVRSLLTRLRREASGQDLIEYALLAAMVVLAVVFGLNTVGAAIQGRYTTVASQLESGTPAPSGGSGSSTGSSSGSASGTSTPPAAAVSGGSSSTDNSSSGNNGNHAGGGNNGNGRGNGGS